MLKLNANIRYATDAKSAAKLKAIAATLGESIQEYVVRSDMGCGSTIGPIAAARIGIDTLDIGIPSLAMHSIRELAGSRDAYSLYRILLGFAHDHLR